jgi:iron complex outermembrane receptor protein
LKGANIKMALENPGGVKRMKQKLTINTPLKASRWLSATASAIALLAPFAAMAAEQGDGMQIEEIVVTAQKRAQSLQDVGITMSAFSGKELKDLNVKSIIEIAANIPSVQVNYAANITVFNIRGIGLNQFATNLDTPVAVNIDEVYQSKDIMTGLGMFDIGRVEVLKGPQGTLFGRNTTGGAVNLFTSQPTDTWEAGATAGYGNYHTYRGEGYVSGPLSNKVSMRLSGFFVHQSDGITHNTTMGVSQGYDRKFAVRGQLAWHDEGNKLLLSFHHGEDRSEVPPYQSVGIFTPASLAAGTPAFCAEYLNGTVTGATANCVRGTDGLNPGTANPYISTENLRQTVHNDSTGGLLRFEHEFDGATLTSITGIESFKRKQQEASDSSPYNIINAFWNENITQVTQEIRLTSSTDTAWHYVVGGYYEHDSFKNRDYLSVVLGAAPGYYTSFGQKNDALAAFFHNSVKVTDTLSLVAGTRFSWERTSIEGGTAVGTGLASIGGITQPTTILGYTATSSAIPTGNSRKDEDASFKMGVEWKPQISHETFDNLLLYFNISTAFRSGGYNAEFAATQDSFTSLSPEKVTAYEGGFKSTLYAHRLEINGALFRYDFKDGFLNVDSATSPIPITINAANIRTLGGELDIHWLPLRGLDLTGGVGFLDSKIKSNISSGGHSLEGGRPVNAPKTTLNGKASYEIPLTSDWRFVVSTDASWRSSQYLYAVNGPANLEKGYLIVNANATLYSADDRYSVSLWVKNLNKRVYRTYVNDLSSFGWLLNVYGPPRTYGISTSFHF